jgi:hypothetical protein
MPDMPESGRLQVEVYEGRGVPAQNAVIRIKPRGEDSVIEELVTDSSGQTPHVSLPAPPKANSAAPGEKPYSEDDITVNRPGFEDAEIEGVQILPETASYQPVSLLPLSYGYDSEDIVIAPHTLWGDYLPKMAESDVKVLPPSKGFVVLPEPVVPEYIVVHTGKPTDNSVADYWIPYKDYIKNVASCEIYATWPEEAIKANILAINSFTLNRVYTEWYPGKGYNFTITNSTSYDHSFIYGRNIFDQISRVVDDIFTTFITRPGIRQPLFAQYCDGKKITCPGALTQWGSRDLAASGYSAIDILRNFYGNDVYLMEAKSVAGVPASYPGTALQTGSKGRDVRTVQEQLNAVSKNYPLIPKVKVDGEFGESTRKAVETFQRIFHLSSDGIVGFATWYKLSNIYVSVTRIGG